MATALKGIQFSSPVLNGTTENGQTTWTYGANDLVKFGCGSDGCDYAEEHYGKEIHRGDVEFNYHTVVFGDCAYETHCGYETHHGSEDHCGYENHYGDETHYGEEVHMSAETHYGSVGFCAYESHSGGEYHNGSYEFHCGYEDHDGFAWFSGTCSCASDGFTGTNIRVSGIAVVDPTNPANKVLLTYSELKSHGF